MQIVDCEQGSPEWFTARLGIPTASEFSTVMASGRGGGESKTRRTYMLKLAGELFTGEPAENFTNAHMERGKVMEDEARSMYAFMHGGNLRRVGFVHDGTDGAGAGRRGASPDCLIDDDGGLEIKTALPHIQIERLLRGGLPPEHKAQVQGSLWVTGRQWWDFVSYWPKLPLFVVRVERDETYIKEIETAVRQFNKELAETVETIRKLNGQTAVAA
jgi:hypothetical protein